MAKSVPRTVEYFSSDAGNEKEKENINEEFGIATGVS